jgi:predicted transcriptional regulator
MLRYGLLALRTLRREKMFHSEIVLLLAIARTKNSGKKLITRPIDITGEYIGYLYDSLVKCGYLKKDKPREYQLTTKGIEVITKFLYKNTIKAKDTIRKLQQLGVEVSPEVNTPEKEATKVN